MKLNHLIQSLISSLTTQRNSAGVQALQGRPIGNSLVNSFGVGQLPQVGQPGMRRNLLQPPVASGMAGDSGLAAAGGALNRMEQLRTQMNSIQNSKMSPEKKQAAMMKLQQQMQQVTQMLQMISKIMQNQHNVATSIINNLPRS